MTEIVPEKVHQQVRHLIGAARNDLHRYQLKVYRNPDDPSPNAANMWAQVERRLVDLQQAVLAEDHYRASAASCLEAFAACVNGDDGTVWLRRSKCTADYLEVLAKSLLGEP